MANSNNVISLQVNSSGSFVSLGEIRKITLPEIVNSSLDSTNYSGGGWKSKISSGLKEIPPFPVTINFLTSASAMIADVVNGTSKQYKVTYPNSTNWTFDALVTRFKVNDADIGSGGEVLRATLTFETSGSPVIS